MPTEITDEEKFIELSGQALECRVKHSQNSIKFKLRTKKRLYTFKASPERADALKKRIQCEVNDIK
ncbi:MAG: hypothetical protein EAX96_02820 [Candidatus Lokiarchaeota archaeon]|nr:hypothetical protein [Candidatus Lokiarchaeota archaeon]